MNNKSKLLQDYFDVRDSASRHVLKKIAVKPSIEGQKFRLRDGFFRFSSFDVDKMLLEFDKCISSAHKRN